MLTSPPEVVMGVQQERRLTFLSVAERLSLCANIQTYVSSLQNNTQVDMDWIYSQLSNLKTAVLMVSYLVPGHWLSPEERAGEFYRETLLVVLGFVLRHTEQNCCSVGS